MSWTKQIALNSALIIIFIPRLTFSSDFEMSKTTGVGEIHVCKSLKLKALVTLCKAYTNCYKKGIKVPNFDIDTCAALSSEKCEMSWDKSEAKANKKGEDCFTSSATEIEGLIKISLKDIYDQLLKGLNSEDKNAMKLAKVLLNAAGQKGSNILNAWAVYMKKANSAKLQSLISNANAKFANSWNNAMLQAKKRNVLYNGPSMEKVGTTVDSMVSGVLAAVSAGGHSDNANAGWRIETITHVPGLYGYIQHNSSIGVDQDGIVHIAAAPPLGLDTPLIYVHKIPNSWSIESRGYGRSPSLGIDLSGTVYLAYDPNSNPGLLNDGVHCAQKIGDLWSDNKIADNSFHPSLCFDRSGGVHVSYFVEGFLPDEIYKVCYASKTGGTWMASIAVIEEVDLEKGENLDWPKMAVDSSGWGYIAYIRSRKNGFCELKLLSQTLAGWVSTVIDTMDFDTITFENILDMAIDGNDHLHIVYWDHKDYFTSNGPYVKYATNASGEWVKNILLNNAFYPAIAVDKNNKVHIVYESRSGALEYVNNASGNWVESTIATLWDSSTLSDIAVDASGRVHVSYYNEAARLLKYATYPVTGVSIDMIAEPEPAVIGGLINYEIIVTNHGSNAPSKIDITDALPNSVKFESASASQGSCNGIDTITCDLGYLASGESAKVNIVVSVDKYAPDRICNTASLAASNDTDTSDNIAIACSTVTRSEVNIMALDPIATEEGDTGKFIISRDGGADNEMTITYSVGGTATPGVDYLELPKSITLEKDQSAAYILVEPKFDTTIEGDETVTVTLLPDPCYSIVSYESATVTIKDYIVFTTFSDLDGPRAVALADLNNDGNLDLVVAYMNVDTVSTYKGDGSGGFSGKTDYSTGDGPRAVALADFNGDDNLDLAVPNTDDNTVSVFIADNVGTFGLKTDFFTGTQPRAVALGDVDGDAKADLVVANYGANNVSVLLNDGSGNFWKRTDIATGLSPVALALGDLNDDKNLDLVVANADSNNVGVFIGDNVGGFEWKISSSTGLCPLAVSLGDINGDGKLDVVAANFYSNNMTILLGDGAGSFKSKSNISTENGPFAVSLGDLDSDDNLDIVVANFNSDSISIFFGDGNGGIKARTDVTVGSAPAALTLGDINNDGKLDIIVACFDSDTIAVMITN